MSTHPPHHKHPIGMEANMKSHGESPSDLLILVCSSSSSSSRYAETTNTTPRPPSKHHQPSPPYPSKRTAAAVRLSIQFHTQKSRNARQKNKPSFSGRTICCCAPSMPCSGRAQKNALYHLAIIINSSCPVSSIDRPPRGTVRLRIEPITPPPPLSTWRQGPSKRLSPPEPESLDPQNIIVAQRSLPNLPALSFAANKLPRPSPTRNILKRPSKRESTTANVRLNPSHAGQNSKTPRKGKRHQSSPWYMWQARGRYRIKLISLQRRVCIVGQREWV